MKDQPNLDGVLTSKKVEPKIPFCTPSKLPTLKDERLRQDDAEEESPQKTKKQQLKMPLPLNSDVKIREIPSLSS